MAYELMLFIAGHNIFEIGVLHESSRSSHITCPKIPAQPAKKGCSVSSRLTYCCFKNLITAWATVSLILFMVILCIKLFIRVLINVFSLFYSLNFTSLS